jgi:uncharacterized protein with GYD domain
MAQYVVLLTFTDQGVKNIKSSQSRSSAEAAVAAAGGRIIWQGLTMGQSDVVVVLELPGDEQALSLALAQATQGEARTQILKAFPPDVVDSILQRLP